jgi:hypothetical protein
MIYMNYQLDIYITDCTKYKINIIYTFQVKNIMILYESEIYYDIVNVKNRKIILIKIKTRDLKHYKLHTFELKDPDKSNK